MKEVGTQLGPKVAKNTPRPIIANTVSSLLLSLFLLFDPEFLMNSLLTLKGGAFLRKNLLT